MSKKQFRVVPRNQIMANTSIPTDVTELSDNEFLKLVCNRLNDLGVDTTIHNYELKAERYERYGGGDTYTVKFKCPGDYLAYFSMSLMGHENVRTLSGLVEAICSYYFADDFDEGFNAMINSCGSTVESMNHHASRSWWGDGDDYIIYLKNLDTDTYLYDNIEEYEEYSSDDEDWDDWDER